MNKKAKITLITVGSVVAAIVIAVIVLCCVTVKPMSDFMDYDTVRITPYSGTDLPDGSVRKEYKDKLDKALEDTSFSVMHAMLEFVGSYGPKFATAEDGDGNETRTALTVEGARSACAATENSYKLEFEFTKEKTYDVDGEKVAYDRMMMNVTSTDGEVRWVRIYLYLSSRDGVLDPENDDYRVNPILVRMNTSDLFIALGEIENKIAG